ncbi:MAG: Na+-driven multidrug efflux pump [Erysipelotrichaceae bacterium]|nr:MAG: Na+-driven multidrug efflux pump [Erysipelotrichaceae bacterium]
MTEQRMLAVNIGSRFFSYTINIGVNFFLTPYIVTALGAATYGYMGLGQNFISYIDIFTFMTAGTLFRFVMIAHTQKKQDDVNSFYSNSFFSTLIYLTTLIIPVSYAIYRLQDFIKVNPVIVNDVKILFVLLLINFIFNTFFLIFRTGTQMVNKIYLISIRDFFAVILETILLLSLYVFFEPKIYYLGISAVVISGMTLIYDYSMLKRFVPYVEIKIKHIQMDKLKELISTGFYYMVKQFSGVLLVGLDLLFANTFISELAMGQLAIAKILPKAMQSFLSLATGSFIVIFTKLYAQRRMEHLVVQVKRGIKVLGTVTMLPNVILIVYGLPFYKLWIPAQDVQLIYVLSVTTALVLVMNGLMFPLNSIFTVTNRLKVSALVGMLYGIISAVTTLLFLVFTDFGIYAIADCLLCL